MPASQCTIDEEPAAVRAEQELRDFAYIVSHDLATTFRHLAFFSKKLSNDLPSESERCREHAAIIQQSADKCQAMLQALLAYSRIQQKEITPCPYQLGMLLDAVRARTGARLLQAGATLACSLEGAGDDAHIEGDAELLTRALIEIVDNAIASRNENRPLVILVTAARTAQGAIELRIEDNGIGLDPECWERAFNMFWRLEPEGASVGSGLALVRRILRRHGGEARFVPSASGACVSLLFPRAFE